ncbi:MAG: hypothetical protein JKY55_00575 [Aliivibrio sp.]|uniref:hypothetical protein n=1 Tax=Aliivibrio sp. TaxID=1872443 RepID=UPI001A5FB81C|nr:hypothetical protein [Aliivibrio sp.]
MSIIKHTFTALLISFLSLSVTASPTSSEFEFCERLAVASLQGCLDRENNVKKSQCWQQSKSGYEQCRSKIIDRHRPLADSEIKAHAKRKILEAEAKAKLQAE